MFILLMVSSILLCKVEEKLNKQFSKQFCPCNSGAFLMQRLQIVMSLFPHAACPHVLMFPIILRSPSYVPMSLCLHVPVSPCPNVPLSQCPCVPMSLIPHAPYPYVLMFPYSQVSPNVLCTHVLMALCLSVPMSLSPQVFMI